MLLKLHIFDFAIYFSTIHHSHAVCLSSVNAHRESTSSHEHTCPVSLVDPHRHRHCSAAYRAVALRKPLAARPAHALVATRDEDMSLGLVQAHDARLAVGIVHRISRCPLLGDLVD